MTMSGTLDEVLESLYELFMEERISDENTRVFLMRLKHESGEYVFGRSDVDKMLKRLKGDREGIKERVKFEEGEFEGENE